MTELSQYCYQELQVLLIPPPRQRWVFIYMSFVFIVLD